MLCANLNLFETDLDKFLLRFVTMDETWPLFHPRIQTTVETMEALWLTPANSGKDCSAGKVMALEFGMLMVFLW